MLVVVFFTGLIFVLFSIFRFRKITNPFILEVYPIFLMIMIPQLLWVWVDDSAEFYLFSDLAILLYIICLYLGTSLNIKAIRLKEIRHVSLVNAANWFLFILFLSPLLQIFVSFEFSIAGIRQFYEFIVFSKYASFFELSKFVLYLIIFYRLIKHKKVTIGTLILVPFLLLYGSKMALLDFVIAFFIFLEYFRLVSYRKLIITSVVCASFLILYRYSQQRGTENVWMAALSYFDQYKNQSFLIEQLVEGEADYYYGEIYWSSYLKYIPRIIWPGKPAEFGFALINYDFMPEAARSGYMPAFGLGSLFADFGFYSIAFGAFTAGLIKRYLYNVFLNSKNNISFLMYAFPLTILSFIFLMINLFIDYLVQSQKSQARALQRQPENNGHNTPPIS